MTERIKLEEYKAEQCTICTMKYPIGFTGFKQVDGNTVVDTEALVVVLCDSHRTLFHDAMGKAIVESKQNLKQV